MFITRRNFGEPIRIKDRQGNSATFRVAFIADDSFELHVDDRDRNFEFDKRPRRGFPGQPMHPFRPRLNFAVDPTDPPPPAPPEVES